MIVLIDDLVAFLGLIWDYFLLGAAEITRRMALVNRTGRTAGETYWESIRRLFIASALTPILLLGVAILFHKKWLIATVGIFWALSSALFLIAMGLIALLASLVLKNPDIRASYIRYAGLILLGELLASIYLIFVPVGDNVEWLPVAVVLMLAYLILKYGTFKSRFAQGVIVILLVMATAAFYKPSVAKKLPKTTKVVENSGPRIDNALAAVLSGEEYQSIIREFPAIKLAPKQILETGIWFEAGARMRVTSDQPYSFRSLGKPIPYPAGTMEWTAGQPGGSLVLEGGDNPATIQVIRLK